MNIFPIAPITPVKGVKDFINTPTAPLTKLNTENNPLNVFLIFPAVSSLILNFSDRFLKPLEISTNFSPVIGGKISLNALDMDFTPFNTPPAILDKPFITSSLPPASFQNSSIAFLASVDGLIRFSNPLYTSVRNFVDSSLSPIIYSHDCAHPEPTDSFIVSINCDTVLTSVAALVAFSANCNICCA